MPKASGAFSRNAEVYDTTIGWRFVNPLMKKAYGVDSMPETAENVAADFEISRADQDAFACRSQKRAQRAQAAGRFAEEIVPVKVAGQGANRHASSVDEHPRPETTLETLARLPALFRDRRHGDGGQCLGRQRRRRGAASWPRRPPRKHTGLRRERAWSAPRPPACRRESWASVPRRLRARCSSWPRIALGDIDVVELNEAFAAQSLAVLRQLGLPDDAEQVNPNGGAIALGHPLGMSGARLMTDRAA